METTETVHIPGSNFGERSILPPDSELVKLDSGELIGNFLDGTEVVQNKVWITSDTHFNHRRILEYEAESRPFKDRDDMNESMIRLWNEKVRDADVVFHLGDFAFASANKIRNYVSRLNGRIFLLLGNHDRENSFNWTDLGFERVYEKPFLLDGRFALSHEPLAEIPDGMVNVYGHVHGSRFFSTFENNRYCVCVERHNCAPIEWNHVKSLYS